VVIGAERRIVREAGWSKSLNGGSRRGSWRSETAALEE